MRRYVCVVCASWKAIFPTTRIQGGSIGVCDGEVGRMEENFYLFLIFIICISSHVCTLFRVRRVVVQTLPLAPPALKLIFDPAVRVANAAEASKSVRRSLFTSPRMRAEWSSIRLYMYLTCPWTFFAQLASTRKETFRCSLPHFMHFCEGFLLLLLSSSLSPFGCGCVQGNWRFRLLFPFLLPLVGSLLFQVTLSLPNTRETTSVYELINLLLAWNKCERNKNQSRIFPHLMLLSAR